MERNFFKDIDDKIIGVDEVGRGALAGPVVSCALLLDKKIRDHTLYRDINDSKKLTEKKRLILEPQEQLHNSFLMLIVILIIWTGQLRGV